MRFKTSISLNREGKKAVELLRNNNINISRYIETLILKALNTKEIKEMEEIKNEKH